MKTRGFVQEVVGDPRSRPTALDQGSPGIVGIGDLRRVVGRADTGVPEF